MKVTVDCPHCDDELEFQTHSDWQGEGVWGMQVDTVELLEKKCECEISDVSMNELANLAIEKAADHDPANDFEPDYSFDNMGGY